MKNIKDSKRENKLLKKFITERGFRGSFRRYKNIKRTVKFDVKFDDTSEQLIAYRRNKRTIVADRFTLKTLATTKRYNLANIQNAFRKKTFNVKRFKSKKIPEFKMSRYDLQLKEISRTKLTNVFHTERTTFLKTLRGQLYIKVAFKSRSGGFAVVEGGSQKLRDFSGKDGESNRQKAFEEAFNGASSQAGFSWDDFEIIWIHYAYFIDRTSKQGAFEI